MKRILAVVIACTLFASSVTCAYAADTKKEGSGSVTAEELEKEVKKLRREIAELEDAIRASQKTNQTKSSGGGGTATYQQNDVYSKNNAVNYGGNIIAQGGHVEINGGKSNVTFKIASVDGGTLTQASSLATSVGGSLINCISTSSPGASFSTAKVNFYIGGVQAGDNIAAYQIQGKNWVQLPVVEIRKDHVVVSMTRHGVVAFVRVPVLAAVTN